MKTLKFQQSLTANQPSKVKLKLTTPSVSTKQMKRFSKHSTTSTRSINLMASVVSCSQITYSKAISTSTTFTALTPTKSSESSRKNSFTCITQRKWLRMKQKNTNLPSNLFRLIISMILSLSRPRHCLRIKQGYLVLFNNLSNEKVSKLLKNNTSKDYGP